MSVPAVIVLSLFLVSGFSLISESAFACGGPAGYDLDTPMHSLDELLGLLTTAEDPYEIVMKDEFLFLYPFRLEKRAGIEPLWTTAYTANGPAFPPPSSNLFEASLKKSDWKTAEAEAQKIVDQVLDMPATVASDHQPPLIRALEFLEIQPLFRTISPALIKSALWDGAAARPGGQLPAELRDVLEMRALDRSKVDEIIKAKPHHPRMGTLRFVSMRNEFARTVPDGWVYDIQTKVSKEEWRRLERSADLWLKDFPQHPLADLVRLWKTRIYYFEGDTARVWENLLSIYPRRLPRILHEMRYMLMHASSEAPKPDMIKDSVLMTALVPSLSLSPDEWSRLWRLSESHASRPWAANLQERLLEKSIHDAREGRESPSYPKEPRNPTPLWGKLRALGLMEMGKWEEARKQLFSLEPDKEQALLAAAYHLRRGKPTLAVQVIDLPEHIRHYLIRVMLSDSELDSLTPLKSAIVRQDALFEKGVRRAEQGKWTEAAGIIKTSDPDRSRLWQKASVLSMDTSEAGRLKWARFLKESNGKLFYGNDSAWYRSVNWRNRRIANEKADGKRRPPKAALPWTSEQEQKAITQHLARTSEMWLALQVYADWLSEAKGSQDLPAVVKEADVCYNWLINWDSTNSDFWRAYLQDHAVVEQLRNAGRRAKKG